ncbi:MAG TPA: NUDIX hydrolase [Candidatus Saccharimonadales bacterium]
MKPWKVLSERQVYEGWRPVFQRTYAHPRLGEATVDISGKKAEQDANMIALDKDGMVIVGRQFRCGPEKVMDELPGGQVDQGETPLHAAIRELAEEVGYKPGAIEELGFTHRDAWRDSVSHYFLAIDCEPLDEITHSHDDFEVIEVQKISIAELINNAKSGHMTDAGGILLAYDKLKELEKKYETTN